jgi:Cu(I)/Ag(I) efflux system membrane fusion protein
MTGSNDPPVSTTSPAAPAPGTDPGPRPDARERHRTRIVSAAVLGALLIVAGIFRHPLVAWFTGSSSGGSTSEAAHVVAGGLAIDTSIQPEPPRENGNRAHVLVRDAQGKPVTGARVRLEYDMPAMGAMQAMHGGIDASEDGDGRYTVPFDLGMGGSWTISVHVKAASAAAVARYTLRVGSSGLTVLGGEASGGSGRETPAAGAGSDIAYYTCSMHPAVHSAGPGKCPICSMDLTPVTREQEQAGVIHIEDSRRALLGIRTTKVVRRSIDLDITAKGRLAIDETRLHEITLKVGGYISDLRVNAAGQAVTRGDTLFTLYSPELYAAEQEYLSATQNRDAMRMTGDASHSERLAHAVETKLRLWGLGDDQLAALTRRGEPIEHVAFSSPASGVVIEKNVVDGAAVMAGQRLFRIADLADIWVEADVYESDLPRITKGMPASITLDYLPGKTFDGKVAFIYPYLDPASRTGRVRIALPNNGLELKPDMYATVAFKLPLGPRLVVPVSAVVYTGPRRIVFVDLGDGALRPQEVTIGARSGDLIEISSGLHAGDVVVSSGNFLVAAESRVRSASSFWEDSHGDR